MSGTPDTTTPAVTEEDRAKAAEIIDAWDADDHGTYRDLAAKFAAALAAERGKADALRAAMHEFTEVLRGMGLDVLAARLRAIADGQR